MHNFNVIFYVLDPLKVLRCITFPSMNPLQRVTLKLLESTDSSLEAGDVFIVQPLPS